MIRKYKGFNRPDANAETADEYAGKVLTDPLEMLMDADVDALKKYADENGINIGGATSQQGIYKKILENMKESTADNEE